jgi:hypothetical protein
MTTKVGILSDKHHRENCLEYMNVPQGYFNAVYRGDMPNINYPGIKSSKYQRAPLKPAHLVDYATNMARLQGGNIANNARNTINTIKPDMVNFVNKPVFPVITTPSTGVVGVPPVLPSVVAPSIGSVISTSTIGTTNPAPAVAQALAGVSGSGFNIDFFKSNFFTKSRAEQELIVKTLGNAFKAESGALPMNYKPSGQKSKQELQVDIDNILRQIEVSGANINVAGIIGIPTQQTLSQIGSAGPSTAPLPPPVAPAPSPAPVAPTPSPAPPAPSPAPPPTKKQISPKRVKSKESSAASQASTILAPIAE